MTPRALSRPARRPSPGPTLLPLPVAAPTATTDSVWHPCYGWGL